MRLTVAGYDGGVVRLKHGLFSSVRSLSCCLVSPHCQCFMMRKPLWLMEKSARRIPNNSNTTCINRVQFHSIADKIANLLLLTLVVKHFLTNWKFPLIWLTLSLA